MRIPRALVLAAALLPSAWAAAAVDLAPLEAPPVEGRPTVLSFTDAGAPAAGLAVTARYRENAHARLQRQQEVGATDAAGRIQWVPERPGVVVLAWDGGSHNVSVVHAGTPPAAVAVAGLAGLILLGGSALFFVQMLRGDSGVRFEDIDERAEQPPST